MHNQTCPLCSHAATDFFENRFFMCTQCKGIFRSSEDLPNANAEKQRYHLHNNDVSDEGYNAFVAPIIQSVFKSHSPDHKGLDFGAGPSSAIAHVLQINGYNIQLYDPFFFDNKALLDATYDYIICCEVMEHFHHPYSEFKLLRQCLKPDGKLYCMTHLYSDQINFGQWYYKNDFTHVFFYQKETLEWINQEFDFKKLEIQGRMLVLGV